MPNTEEFDLNNICRTCMSSNNLKSLYEESSYDQMLLICTTVVCSKNDGLPEQMCSDCILELKRASVFATKCQKTDKKLRMYIQKQANPNMEPDCSNTKLEQSLTTIKSLRDPLDINGIKMELDDEFDVHKVKIETNPDIKFEPQDPFEIHQVLLPEIEYYEEFHQNSQLDSPTRLEAPDEQGQSLPIFYRRDVYKYLSANKNEEPATVHYILSELGLSANCPSYYVTELCQKVHIFLMQYTQRWDSCIGIKRWFEEKNRAWLDAIFALPTYPTVGETAEKREKPYACTVCRTLFKRNYNLTVHMRKHTGNKPYSCTVCDRSFSKQSNVSRHMRTHTAKKVYS